MFGLWHLTTSNILWSSLHRNKQVYTDLPVIKHSCRPFSGQQLIMGYSFGLHHFWICTAVKCHCQKWNILKRFPRILCNYSLKLGIHCLIHTCHQNCKYVPLFIEIIVGREWQTYSCLWSLQQLVVSCHKLPDDKITIPYQSKYNYAKWYVTQII